MTIRVTRAIFGSIMALGMMFASMAPAAAQYWQCAPYAREISGIQIRGNANTWWGQADGHYARGTTPKIGAVMAFKAHAKMRVGHVAMVSQIVSDREVLLTHANWSRGGQIERDVRAIDVSAAGDWSQVKVWYGPIGDLGMTSYPLYGFIYADQPEQEKPLLIASAGGGAGSHATLLRK
ncbi:CHAP domain-containing protein [Sphingobium boeckii]|uniref:Surface antigen n=1 Tax=Sphingobium boeckii TaxID=1082345 RepID=A0A7W9AFH2_9SPHN|nr:CHAP domain-containing protein [Sphingobium boeckii]MBB5684628.1 surface antigen [Sphingobium boeckii]